MNKLKCEECGKRNAIISDGSYHGEHRWCERCWANLNYDPLIDEMLYDIGNLFLQLKIKPTHTKKIYEIIKEMEICYKILKKQRLHLIK